MLTLETIDVGTNVTTIVDYELLFSVLGKLIDKLKAGKEIQEFIKTDGKNTKQILERE